ncbi:MAG: metallopeptidase family protein [Coriobacteriales bacterium]|jgi:predicted Zn-dependent protease with MMP-like domain
MVKLTDAEFEGAIADALDSMPDEFIDELENIVVIAQDEPEDWQLEAQGYDLEGYDDEYEDGDGDPGDLLGYYDGVSLYERADGYGGPADYPDTIFIFKGPHERLDGTKAEILDEVRRTVVHEIGHYFGMDEDQIDEMGYA